MTVGRLMSIHTYDIYRRSLTDTGRGIGESKVTWALTPQVAGATGNFQEYKGNLKVKHEGAILKVDTILFTTEEDLKEWDHITHLGVTFSAVRVEPTYDLDGAFNNHKVFLSLQNAISS